MPRRLWEPERAEPRDPAGLLREVALRRRPAPAPLRHRPGGPAVSSFGAPDEPRWYREAMTGAIGWAAHPSGRGGVALGRQGLADLAHRGPWSWTGPGTTPSRAGPVAGTTGWAVLADLWLWIVGALARPGPRPGPALPVGAAGLGPDRPVHRRHRRGRGRTPLPLSRRAPRRRPGGRCSSRRRPAGGGAMTDAGDRSVVSPVHRRGRLFPLLLPVGADPGERRPGRGGPGRRRRVGPRRRWSSTSRPAGRRPSFARSADRRLARFAEVVGRGAATGVSWLLLGLLFLVVFLPVWLLTASFLSPVSRRRWRRDGGGWVEGSALARARSSRRTFGRERVRVPGPAGVKLARVTAAVARPGRPGRRRRLAADGDRRAPARTGRRSTTTSRAAVATTMSAPPIVDEDWAEQFGEDLTRFELSGDRYLPFLVRGHRPFDGQDLNTTDRERISYVPDRVAGRRAAPDRVLRRFGAVRRGPARRAHHPVGGRPAGRGGGDPRRGAQLRLPRVGGLAGAAVPRADPGRWRGASTWSSSTTGSTSSWSSPPTSPRTRPTWGPGPSTGWPRTGTTVHEEPAEPWDGRAGGLGRLRGQQRPGHHRRTRSSATTRPLPAPVDPEEQAAAALDVYARALAMADGRGRRPRDRHPLLLAAPPGRLARRRSSTACPPGSPTCPACSTGSRSTIYIDEVHTNEAGARLAAEALWVDAATRDRTPGGSNDGGDRLRAAARWCAARDQRWFVLAVVVGLRPAAGVGPVGGSGVAARGHQRHRPEPGHGRAVLPVRDLPAQRAGQCLQPARVPVAPRADRLAQPVDGRVRPDHRCRRGQRRGGHGHRGPGRRAGGAVVRSAGPHRWRPGSWPWPPVRRS